LRELRASASAWERVSANALSYFGATHALDAVMPVFERVLVDVAVRRGRAPLAGANAPRLVS
jgi:hypothetical protein